MLRRIVQYIETRQKSRDERKIIRAVMKAVAECFDTYMLDVGQMA